MIRSAKVYLLIIVLFVLSQVLYANEILVSTSSADAINLTFLFWLVTLPIMKLIYKEKFLGISVVSIIALYIFYKDLGVTVWMFYIGTVFVMYLFGKKRFEPRQRKINLIYYGIILLFLIVGGIVSKIIYYSNAGGYARYTANMRNMIPIFIIPYIVLATIVILYVYLNVLKKKRVKPEEEIESL